MKAPSIKRKTNCKQFPFISEVKYLHTGLKNVSNNNNNKIDLQLKYIVE